MQARRFAAFRAFVSNRRRAVSSYFFYRKWAKYGGIDQIWSKCQDFAEVAIRADLRLPGIHLSMMPEAPVPDIAYQMYADLTEGIIPAETVEDDQAMLKLAFRHLRRYYDRSTRSQTNCW